jgi:hypothetical protein
MKKPVLSLAAMKGMLMIPTNSVRLSSLLQISQISNKKSWIALSLPFHDDYFLTVNTASGKFFENRCGGYSFQTI